MIIINGITKEKYNAGPKAPKDINKICKEKLNFEEKLYDIKEYNNKMFSKLINSYTKDNILRKIKKNNEYIVIQMPFSRSNYFYRFVKKNNVILFVHDLIGLRLQNKLIEKRELKIYNEANKIIVHNEKMKEYFIKNGIDERKIVVLELFDYLCNSRINDSSKDIKKSKFEIVYAGNLNPKKCNFLYNIDEKKLKYSFNLYGVGLNNDINNKLKYKGKYLPEELPNKIVGELGLVWDGKIDDSDEAMLEKNYTKYNNPHKLSLYIAAGIPVIVWEKSAISDFVKKENIGYTINNIYDINKLDFSNYEEKKKNINNLSEKVQNGYYTQRAFNEILKIIKK